MCWLPLIRKGLVVARCCGCCRPAFRGKCRTATVGLSDYSKSVLVGTLPVAGSTTGRNSPAELVLLAITHSFLLLLCLLWMRVRQE